MSKEIPIQNIYYILSYAWNKLEESEIVNVENIDGKDSLSLFATVLKNGVAHLIKQGLDRGYVNCSNITQKLKGKINFANSLKMNLGNSAKLICNYDELDYNILHNKILKSSINLLLKNKNLEDKLKDNLYELRKYFIDVKDIELRKNLFGKLQLHSNNSFYIFLMNICFMIYSNTFISEESGNYEFKDFIRDEKQMPYVFENFIRNFYDIEQNEFNLLGQGREDIQWKVEPLGDSSEEILPKMQTDLSLISDDRKIIIDAKFYKNALSERNFKDKLIEKIHSKHIYQMYSYLKNQEEKEDQRTIKCNGILLYPAVNTEFSESFNFDGHPITFATINLNSDWKKIRNGMLELIEQ